MMAATCQYCDWSGPVTDLVVRQETDHEVWNLYCCPDCCQEIGRESEGWRKKRITSLRE